MPRRITTYEHTTLEVELEPTVAAGLRSAAEPTRLGITPHFTPGRYVLRTTSFVGSLVTDDVELLIRPKVPMRNLLALLAPDVSTIELDDAQMHYDEDSTLLEAVAALYDRSVNTALARGMRRQYVGHEERLVALRGRVDMGAQSRSPLPTPLACRFDEYSIDTPHNQLLKAALVRLVRLEHLDADTRASLRRTLSWFGDVDDRCPPVAPLLQRGFSRLDAHYRTPVELAALIVEDSSLRDRFGQHAGASFLIDMNAVFERYVTAALRTHLQPLGLVVSDQHPGHLDWERSVVVRPDVVVLRGDEPVFVADLKYKAPDEPEGRNADLYQLLAYATAIDLPEGMLVYAGGGDGSATVLHVGPDPTTLVVERVDLSGSLADIRRSMRTLARSIATRSETPRATATAMHS